LLDWDNLPYVEYNFVKFHQYQFIHIKELQEIQEIFTEQSDSYINANMFKERFVVTMREGVNPAFTTYGHQSLSCLVDLTVVLTTLCPHVSGEIPGVSRRYISQAYSRH